jgi:hypothetical protein
MMRHLGLTLVAACVLGGAVLAGQARGYCADCHFASTDAPARDHLDAWSVSAHGRANVGCERCHGGDPTTADRFEAHQRVLGSSNPSSPVFRANLPRTCGQCHIGPFVEFQQSQHFALLNEGDRRGPTCTTCHGSVAAQLASPRGLEQRCEQCHGPSGREPREGRSAQARALLEGIGDVRESLGAATRLIDRVSDPARRLMLDAARQQADVPLAQARQAGHRFVFDELESRLAVARQRTAALMQLLLSPAPPPGE